MNPRLKARKFKLPKACAPLVAVVVREIDADDQREGARLAGTIKALHDEEAIENLTREVVRLSVVAVQRQGQTEPQPVGQPWVEMDELPWHTVQFVNRCFHRVNSLDEREVGECMAAAEEWTGPIVAKRSSNGSEEVTVA